MSDFWERKMNTYFKRIDFDHDGVITRKDFEGMGEKFSAKLDKDKAQQLRDKICQVWDKYLSAVGGGKALSNQAFVSRMKTVVKDPTLKGTVEGPLPLFFEAVDQNQDGMIQQSEYADFFDLLGLDPRLATDSFTAIDTNKDGLLSMAEFTEAGSEFFISEDENRPTKLFWGPLL